jgi:hypothetical protein
MVQTWISLRKLGNNKIVQSAWIWSAIVPITAKLFEKVQSSVNMKIFDSSFELNLHLPFSWKILFFVSVSFMVANILYKYRCPALLQETDTFRDFEGQKRSGLELDSILSRVSHGNDEEKNLIDSWRHYFAVRKNQMLTLNNHQGNKDITQMDSQILPEVYHFLSNKLTYWHPKSRLFASLLYGIGFMGLVVLAIQNIYFVVKQF